MSFLFADNSASDSVHPVLTGSEATEAEAESEEKETLLIVLTAIPASNSYFSFTLDRNAPCASDSDCASDSVASVNQP